MVVAWVAVVMVAWGLAIGPVAVWRVITHGTTTVWDHLEYPGRDQAPTADAGRWPVRRTGLMLPEVEVDGEVVPLASILAERDTLAFLIVHDGVIAHEWYADDHDAATPSMLFSVSKSLFSLLIGAAVEDGLLDLDGPISTWVPELGERGYTDPIPNLLTMRSGSSYVENDNPFGAHVEFNYTDDLEGTILGLSANGPRSFRYKSGDYAVLSLALQRALGDQTITGYFVESLWGPLGAEHPGRWVTDKEDGLERVWCCLAMTARDLARFGQLVVDRGQWIGEQVVPAEWIDQSLQPAVPNEEWEDYADSAFDNYGYGWWLTDSAAVAFGKDGQYLYIDRERGIVIVRLGESQGGIGWVDILEQVAEYTAR